MVNYLDYKDIEFPVSKKDYKKIEQSIKFALMYSAGLFCIIWFNLSCSHIKTKV